MTTHVEQHTSADQSVSSTLATHTTSGVPSKRTIVLLFTGLMVTMLMASLSQTILSTALPTIVGELGGVDKMTWVVTGYILASTIMMPVYGRISDLLGRKPVIITAILLFIAGSVAGGMSETINMLVVARVIQGIGGGGLMILSQSAIADVVPARERGKYMGVMGAVFAVSSAGLSGSTSHSACSQCSPPRSSSVCRRWNALAAPASTTLAWRSLPLSPRSSYLRVR